MTAPRNAQDELLAVGLAAQGLFMSIVAEELVALGVSAAHLADRFDASGEALDQLTGYPGAGGALQHIAQQLRVQFGTKPNLPPLPGGGRPN